MPSSALEREEMSQSLSPASCKTHHPYQACRASIFLSARLIYSTPAALGVRYDNVKTVFAFAEKLHDTAVKGRLPAA